MTLFEAIAIIEGMTGYQDKTETEHLKAWAYLIKSGKVWELQGTYSRFAARLITEGIISKQGDILNP